MISTNATDYTKRRTASIADPYSSGPSSGSYYQNGVADEPQKAVDTVKTDNTVAPYTIPTSVSSENLKAFNEDKSRNLGKDPGYTTTAGAEYADRVTKGLTSPDASSVNAQNTADTNASRRQYMANLQAGEAIGQSGFGAGTAQADRIRMNAQAGVNSANQAGQNSANEYLRQRTDRNMELARGLEGDQYGKSRNNISDVQGQALTDYAQSEKATDRGIAENALVYSHGRDAIGDAVDTRNFNAGREDVATANKQWDTERGDRLTQQGIVNAQWTELNEENKAQRAIENKIVLDGLSETAKRGLINSLPEGPAKNTAIAELGKETPIADVLSKLFNADGSLKIVGDSPIASGLKGETEYATQTVHLQHPELDQKSPAFADYVNKEILRVRNAKDTPINDATTSAATKIALAVLSKDPTKLDATQRDLLVASGDIKSYPEVTGVPVGAAAKELIGQQVKIGQEFYTVVNSGSVIRDWEGMGSNNKKTDYTELKGPSGPMYVVNGKLTDVKPVDVAKPSGTDVLFNNFGIDW